MSDNKDNKKNEQGDKPKKKRKRIIRATKPVFSSRDENYNGNKENDKDT